MGLALKSAAILPRKQYRPAWIDKQQTRLQLQQQQQRGKQQQQQQQQVTTESTVMVPMEARPGHHPLASLTTSLDSLC